MVLSIVFILLAAEPDLDAGVAPQVLHPRPLGRKVDDARVDLVLASYSITDERRQVVGQTGPYFITGQQLMVKKGSDITSVADLKGKLANPPGGCGITLRFSPGMPLDAKRHAGLLGDRKLSSSDAKLLAVKPMLTEWSVGYAE